MPGEYHWWRASAENAENVRNVSTHRAHECINKAYQRSEVRFMVKTLPHIRSPLTHPRWTGLKNVKGQKQAEVCVKAVLRNHAVN